MSDSRHRRRATAVAVAIGGAGGALARYGLARWLPTNTGHFPWSTFTVNVTGSALLGVLLTVVMERWPRGRLARPLLGTGMIGAYTTFSTLAVDTVLLGRDGRVGTAALYLSCSLAAGLAAVGLAVAGTRLALGVTGAGGARP